MILSGRDIKWYVETGKLKIYPVEENQYQQNGIDLKLDLLEGRSRGRGRFFVDGVQNPKRFEFASFYLGCTKETIEMPDDLMAFVELRSTWARTGLMLPPTIVDAGFKGNLTLEVISFSDNDLVPYGERFAHLIFAKMSSPSAPYSGKYQQQTGITLPKND